MKKYTYINKGQFLKDVISEIPSNTIIYKHLTGIGATTLMLESAMNAIIVVPNVPVIKDKCKKLNKNKRKNLVVKGVYQAVTIQQITDYLNSDVKTKKFLTTPESYLKIKEAIDEHPDFNLHTDFFLLIDECERLVQDVNFRENILLPMNDFFSFRNKALISATPTEFSDPRYQQEGFKKLYIKPTFDYSKPMKLVETNNIEYTLDKFIKDNPREHYFIFHNSTDSIAYLIRKLGIKDKSAVFCAEDSKVKLKGNGFDHIYTELDEFRTFNFFTSRFYSALDIEFRGDPTIILLTDLQFADHSMIDPLSESIQIVGRFRDFVDFKPAKEIVHITNFNPQARLVSMSELEEDIRKGAKIHAFLKRYLSGATTLMAVRTLEDILQRIQNSFCITSESEINYYLKDNKYLEQELIGHYLNAEKLTAAYKKSKHFQVEHLKEEYSFTDKDRKKLSKKESLTLKSIYELLAPLLQDLNEMKKTEPMLAEFERAQLNMDFGKYLNELEAVGLEEAKSLGYNQHAIRKAIKEKANSAELSNFEFIDFLEEEFRVGQRYLSSQIRSIMQEGLSKYDLFKLTPGVRLLREYFEIDRAWIGRNRGYVVRRRIL